ncbi:hypothetical protein M3J09_006704 [Ascochyta lentis]
MQFQVRLAPPETLRAPDMDTLVRTAWLDTVVQDDTSSI